MAGDEAGAPFAGPGRHGGAPGAPCAVDVKENLGERLVVPRMGQRLLAQEPTCSSSRVPYFICRAVSPPSAGWCLRTPPPGSRAAPDGSSRSGTVISAARLAGACRAPGYDLVESSGRAPSRIRCRAGPICASPSRALSMRAPAFGGNRCRSRRCAPGSLVDIGSPTTRCSDAVNWLTNRPSRSPRITRSRYCAT